MAVNASPGTTVIPTMRYDDAPAAIEWLCSVLGFKKHLVVAGEGDTIAHAQLSLGSGMIMLGSARNDEFGQHLAPPQRGATLTQSTYLVVADADLIYRRAVDAGAEILLEIRDEDYGGRGFSCRDPQGQIWSIGTYDPWQES